jgi:hypothetical protein
VWVCASHSCCVFLNALTLFCEVSNVICNRVYLSELLFNNFLFVYAYSNFTNSLREGRVGFSVLLHNVTNFRKLLHSHMNGWGMFASHMVSVAPLKDQWGFATDILTWLTCVHTSNCILHFHWYVNERPKNCHLPTKIYFIYQCCVLKNLLKWHAFTPASVRRSAPNQVSQEETPAKILKEFSPYLSNYPSMIRPNVRGEYFLISYGTRSFVTARV